MIRVRYLRAFDESIAAMDGKTAAQARQAVSRLLEYFDGGPKPLGLGLRKLRAPYWEIRLSLGRRVVFSLEKDLATFILAGNHDEIRRRIA